MGLEMIAVFRKEKKMTIDELSEKSGVPVSTIKKISAGITTDPNLSTIQAIASALGCSIDDFSNSSKFGDTFSSIEKKMIKMYRSLDRYGQELLRNVLEHEHERCQEQSEKEKSLRKLSPEEEAALELPELYEQLVEEKEAEARTSASQEFGSRTEKMA